MAPFATSATGYTRSNSVDTMATADLASQAPVRSQSGYGGFDDQPYRDTSPVPGMASNGAGAGGYGQATFGGPDYPRQQTYRPVNLS